MSTDPTLYPYRQALNETLRLLILTGGVPAINADFTARAVTVGGNVPQFGDASVVNGDLLGIRDATICVVDGGEDNSVLASEGVYLLTLRTQIRVKTLYAMDDAPEDFNFFAGVVQDNLRDLLTSQKNYTLSPLNPATGHSVLPGGQQFLHCTYLGARHIPLPVQGPDRVTRTRGLVLMHQAEIQYTMFRPSPLGG